MASHSVNTVFNSGMHFTSDVGGHPVNIDAGIADGGSNSAPSPKKLMLASLAGCTGIDIVMILNKMKVSFSDLSINVDAQLSESSPQTYEKVHIVYSIKIATEDLPKMERAVSLSQDTYCGVSKMFRSFSVVTSEIVII